MTTPVYTSIPDTSDSTYWQALPYDPKDKTTRFIPRDRELHRQLKATAWQAIQRKIIKGKIAAK